MRCISIEVQLLLVTLRRFTMVNIANGSAVCEECNGESSSFACTFPCPEKSSKSKENIYFSSSRLASSCLGQVMGHYPDCALHSSAITAAEDATTSAADSSLFLNPSKDGDSHPDFLASTASVDGSASQNCAHITQTIVQHEKKMGHYRVQRDAIERSVRKALAMCGSPGDIQYISISRRIGGISYFCFRSHFCQEYLLFRHFASRNIHLLGVNPSMQWRSAEGYVKTAKVYMELGIFDPQNLLPLQLNNHNHARYTGSSQQKLSLYDTPQVMQTSSTACSTAATTTSSLGCSSTAEHNVSSFGCSTVPASLKSSPNVQRLPMRSPKLPKLSSLIAAPFVLLQDIGASPNKEACQCDANSASSTTPHSTDSSSLSSLQQSSKSTESITSRCDSIEERNYFVQQANLNCETMFKRAMQLVLPNGPLRGLPCICRPVAVKLLGYQNIAIFPLRCGDLRNLLHRDDCEVYRRYMRENPRKIIELLIQISAVVKRLHQCTVNLNAYLGNRKQSCKPHGLVHTDLKLENFLFDPIPFQSARSPLKSLSSNSLDFFNRHSPASGNGYISPERDAKPLTQEFSFLVELTDFDGLVNEGQRMQGNSTPGYVSPQMIMAHAERNHNYRARQADDAWALGEVLKRIAKVLIPPFHPQHNSIYKSFLYPLIKQLQQNEPSVRLTVPATYSRLCSFYRKFTANDVPPAVSLSFTGYLGSEALANNNSSASHSNVTSSCGNHSSVYSPSSRKTFQKSTSGIGTKDSLKCSCHASRLELAAKKYARTTSMLRNEGMYLHEASPMRLPGATCTTNYGSKSVHVIVPAADEHEAVCISRCVEKDSLLPTAAKQGGLEVTEVKHKPGNSIYQEGGETLPQMTNVKTTSMSKESAIVNGKNQTDHIVNSSIELRDGHICDASTGEQTIQKNEKVRPILKDVSIAGLPHLEYKSLNESSHSSEDGGNASSGTTSTKATSKSNAICIFSDVKNEICDGRCEKQEALSGGEVDDTGVQVPCILSDGQIKYIRVPAYLSPTTASTVVSILTASSSPVSSSPCVSPSPASAIPSPRCESPCLYMGSFSANNGDPSAVRSCEQRKVLLRKSQNGLVLGSEVHGKVSRICTSTVTQQILKAKASGRSPLGGAGTIATTTEGSPCSSVVYSGTTFIDLALNIAQGDVEHSFGCAYPRVTDGSGSGRHSEVSADELPWKDGLHKPKRLSVPLPEEHAIDCSGLFAKVEGKGSCSQLPCPATLRGLSERDAATTANTTPVSSNIIKCGLHSTAKESALVPHASSILSSSTALNNNVVPQRTGITNSKRSISRDHFAQMKNNSNRSTTHNQVNVKGSEFSDARAGCQYISREAICFLQPLNSSNSDADKMEKQNQRIRQSASERKKSIGWVGKCASGANRSVQKPSFDPAGNVSTSTSKKHVEFDKDILREKAAKESAVGNTGKTPNNDAWQFLLCDKPKTTDTSSTPSVPTKTHQHVHKANTGKPCSSCSNFLSADAPEIEKVKEDSRRVKKSKSTSSKAKRETVPEKRSTSKGRGMQGVFKTLARKLFGTS